MDTCDPGGNSKTAPEMPNLADLCALIPNGAHLSTLANNLAHPFNADQMFDTDFNFDDIVFQQTKNILPNQSNGASTASSALNTSGSSNGSSNEKLSKNNAIQSQLQQSHILQQHAELIQAAQSGNATQAQLQSLQNLKIKFSGESDTADSALLRLSRDSVVSSTSLLSQNLNSSRSNSTESHGCAGHTSDSGNSTNGNKSPRTSQETQKPNFQQQINQQPQLTQEQAQQVQNIAQQAQQQAQQQGMSPQQAQQQAVQAAQAAFAQAAMQDAFFRNNSNASSRNHSSNSSISNISANAQARLEADALIIEPERTGSKKTAYNEKWGVKVLKAWCIENQVDTEFEKLTPEFLDKLLVKFWTEVRKSNGDYYGRNSLFNLRAMINKHLKGRPYNVNFDIVTDERFRTSNECLEKQLKLLKGIGRTITHKQPISIADLRRMYDSGVLGTANPLALLRKVWFEITLHFCHKGSESQEKLLKNSFEIYRDITGRAYVARSRTKDINGQTVHQPPITPYDDIRMYETGGDLCPVKSFQLYLVKLHPLQPRLFQQPRRKATPDSPMWYGKAPIGEKALQQMMANISAASKLSKRYTNHCVRTTALEQFSNSRRKMKSNESQKAQMQMAAAQAQAQVQQVQQQAQQVQQAQVHQAQQVQQVHKAQQAQQVQQVQQAQQHAQQSQHQSPQGIYQNYSHFAIQQAQMMAARHHQMQQAAAAQQQAQQNMQNNSPSQNHHNNGQHQQNGQNGQQISSNHKSNEKSQSQENTISQFFAAHQQNQDSTRSSSIENPFHGVKVKTESCESSRNTSSDSNGFPRIKTESIDHDEGHNTLEALFAKEAAKHQCEKDRTPEKKHSIDFGSVSSGRRPSIPSNDMVLQDDITDQINLKNLLNTDLFNANGEFKPLSAQQLAFLGQHL